MRRAVDAAVAGIFNVFWFIPLYLISFGLSARWYQDIAAKAWLHCADDGSFQRDRRVRTIPPKPIKDLVA